ncbi:hypothetical protein KFL_000270440 [Klebsormidium nitens]|uniref:Uncharacterized protein n=1 Tax=Klebsormidium nitens TaxID=105231 RepID=A0A1Y1HKZ4_KLENI|nr:hypothetical protein KFL_000270440 [Klebsormidium nitens]|eukprot:GAQ79284.1 hypothetical protein KFL_000270440 [Klebsormidium nitens]
MLCEWSWTVASSPSVQTSRPGLVLHTSFQTRCKRTKPVDVEFAPTKAEQAERSSPSRRPGACLSSEAITMTSVLQARLGSLCQCTAPTFSHHTQGIRSAHSVSSLNPIRWPELQTSRLQRQICFGAADGSPRGVAVQTRAGKNRPGPAERRRKEATGKAPPRKQRTRAEELMEEAESQELSEEEFNAMLDELDAELEEDLKAGRIKEVGGVLIEVDADEGGSPAAELGASVEDEEEWKQRVVAEIKRWAEEEAEGGEALEEGEDFEEGDEFEEDFDEFDEFEEGEFDEEEFEAADVEGEESGNAESSNEQKNGASELESAKAAPPSEFLISGDLGSQESPATETEATEGELVSEEKAETPEEAEERAAMALALSEITTWQERKLRWALEKSEHRRHKLEIKNIVSDTKLPRKVVLAWLKIHIKEPPRPLESAVPKKSAPADAVAEGDGEEEELRGPSKKRIKKVNLETFEKVYRIAPQPSREQIQDLVKLTHIPYKTVVEWFDKRNGFTASTSGDVRQQRKDERKKRGARDDGDELAPLTMIEPENDGVSIRP